MKKYQVDAKMSQARIGKDVARTLGIAYQDLPSKYLIYGTNVRSLDMTDETFSVQYVPTDLNTDWFTEIAALVEANPVYIKFAKADIKNWALTMQAYRYLNDPSDNAAPAYLPPAMAGAPADADGKLERVTDWVIKIDFVLVKIDNMGQ